MKKRILVVDDEDDILNLVRLILEDAGFECDTASNGVEGLELIEKKRFDLVLLDIMMPFSTGWEVLKVLRARLETRALPVAMLTARAVAQETQTADLPGFDDYITKPFEPDELIRRVKRIFELNK